MRKRAGRFLFAVLILAVLTVTACTQVSRPPAGKEKALSAAGPDRKIRVVATIFPLYDFTRQVGGERVEVFRLLPAGAEPHTWEPSPRDLAGIFDARVLVYNGAGTEPWVEKLKNELINKGVVVVEAAAGLATLMGEEGESGKETAFPAGYRPAGVDPHVWLDPVLAEEMVKRIAGALAEADPRGREGYLARAEEYCRRLKELDEEYRRALGGLSGRKIVVTHEAFGYLARRYGLVQIGITSLAPDREPEPRQMKKVAEICRQDNIRYIFFEPQVSPRLAEAVARETGARTLVLHPLASLTPEQESAGLDYIALMRENLANLKTALEGQ